ncbi:cupin domain-containing protein [Nocardioides limicola]|uniref:cupin domain-containing protein n=1 Tax=Nocardioides limicola TaxID=2803368 RepID=UPI00193BD64D|nr:cupin domain-containing protein [Nocardioides sp. DJM-14]
MTEDWRRVENPAQGEALMFVETSAESGGSRVVVEVEVQPGGGPAPHAHRPEETFELVSGAVELLLDGSRRPLEPGVPVVVAPGRLHTFTNPGDELAKVKVTVVPPMDFERIMRALAGLQRDGRLPPPGGRPSEPALMASLAVRNDYYQPPLPRPLWRLLMGAMAPFGRRACEEALKHYDREHPAPGERSP